MKRFVLAGVLGLTSVGGAGCGKAPSEDQCKRLLDHIVDLELKKAGTAEGSAAAKADLEKLRAKVTEMRTADFLDVCTTKTSKSRVECGLEATSVECSDNQKECGSLADCDTK
jgi:hypothetical protein